MENFNQFEFQDRYIDYSKFENKMLFLNLLMNRGKTSNFLK